MYLLTCIALIKLVGKGQSGPQPIKLPRGVSEQPVEGDKVVVAGWGFSCGGDKNCDDQDLLPTTLRVDFQKT